MWNWFHRLGAPKSFYEISGRLLPWFWVMALLLIVVGMTWALLFVPEDYQQGNSVRIMYIHVPAAILAQSCYAMMAFAAGVYLVWRIKLADVALQCALPIGASITFLALVTGSIWGKPMWGTYWVWDARLTSELVLLFLYFGVMGLHAAIDDKRTASRAAAVLALVGAVNIPIIHYPVQWWSTLHQGPTVSKIDAPSIHLSMLVPLLIMALAFKLYYVTVLLLRARTQVLERERASTWVRELVVRGT